ncbi:MAG: hypothetical protein ACRCVT_00255 [Leadbetterella sp.]
MKKITLLISILLSCISGMASNTITIKPNPSKEVYVKPNFKEELSSLDQIESLVQNGQIDLETLRATSPSTVQNLDNSSTSAISAIGEVPLGIPSIVWGICLGLLGVLIVYLVTDKDNEQTKKAFVGCLIGTAIWLVLNFTVW